MPGIKSVNFGISPDKQFDDGTQSSIAINNSNQFVEVHRGESDIERNLLFRFGQVSGVSLTFSPAKPDPFTTGNNPTVALTNAGKVIEAHDDGGKLYYSVRTLSNNGPSAATETELPNQDAESSDPTLAVNAGGVVVAIHRMAGGALRYRLGQITAGILTWQQNSSPILDSSSGNTPPPAVNGSNPSVAINIAGRVVAVYQSDDGLFSLTGKLAQAAGTRSITWLSRNRYDSGNDPSVALTGNSVFEAHKGKMLGNLYQRAGTLSDDGTSIDWERYLGGDSPSYLFDIGVRPRIATNDKVAVQVHQSETRKSLFGTASLVFDRANWINDNFGALRDKTLSKLVLPASHDAAQYREEIALQTQTLDIFGQLSVGVRWFDLRLAVDGDKIKIHHSIFLGVDFQTVLDDVLRFIVKHNELVILKISHFLNFDQTFGERRTSALAKTIMMIKDTKIKDTDPEKGLRQYLVTGDLGRLGAVKLRQLIGPGVGAVLVVADNKDDDDRVQSYLEFDPTIPANKGVRRYRDWYASDPQNGDLTVFDIFSNTTDFDDMATGTSNDPDSTNARERPTGGGSGERLPVGQFPKFALFDGNCRLPDPEGKNVPCDLFLLSWTLTPSGASPVSLSRTANKQLVQYSADRPGANPDGRIINLLYTDVSQDSRSADVALIRNGLVS